MTSDYTVEVINGVGIVKNNMLDAVDVSHGFTTRLGGISKPPIDTLNLGFNRPEPRETVIENYKRLCDAYGLDFNSLVLVSYEHGTNVEQVTRKDTGRGIFENLEPLPPCDGIVTNDPEVTLFTLHADCSAFFVVDPIKRAIGLAHAGWKGTFGKIGENLVKKLQECYGCKPADLYAVVSPCICRNCFEVGKDIADMFRKEYGDDVVSYTHIDDSKAYVDIRQAAHIIFENAGLLKEHIGDIPMCTYENPDLLYSYRRDGRNKTGAMGAFLKLGK